MIALTALIALTACIPNGNRPEPRADYYAGDAYSRNGDSPGYPGDDQQQDQEQDRRKDDDGVVTLPSPPPAWQARPVTADAQDVAPGSYIVHPGDTLRAIAERTGAGSEAIARANAIPAPYVIQVGQRLTIPGGRYHMVRLGETGIAIARAYGIDWSRIVTANDLTTPYVLRVGMRVLIPGAAPGRGGIEERAMAFTLDVDDLVTGSSPAIRADQSPARPAPSSARVLASTTPVAEPAQLRGAFMWPVRGRVVGKFGPGASGEKINGIKIAVPLDTPIQAAADGVVAYAGDEIPALGGLVIIKHGDGWTTVYGHASKLLVQRGQSVKRGQTIAISGDSGFADRPEVHFEMRKGRTPVNPLPQLPRL